MLVTRSGGYLLAAKPEQVDAERFEAAVADARDALALGDAARARELLVSALALWRGEPLADLAYERFAGGEVARLEEAHLAALEDRIEADLALGSHRAVVGELEALVVDHPNSERLLGQLMLALYRSGRQVEALDAYRRGTARFVTGLGSSRDRSSGRSSSASSRRTRRSRPRRLDGYGTAVRQGAGWWWLSSVRPSSRHPSRGQW